jgi:hypothetical protein
LAFLEFAEVLRFRLDRIVPNVAKFLSQCVAQFEILSEHIVEGLPRCEVLGRGLVRLLTGTYAEEAIGNSTLPLTPGNQFLIREA